MNGTRCRNHVHNILLDGPDAAQPLEAKDAHSVKNRSDLADKALHVSKANGMNIVPLVRFRYFASLRRSASVAATKSIRAARSTKSPRVGFGTTMSFGCSDDFYGLLYSGANNGMWPMTRLTWRIVDPNLDFGAIPLCCAFYCNRWTQTLLYTVSHFFA